MRCVFLALLPLLLCSAVQAETCADYGYTNQRPWIVYGGAVFTSPGAVIYNPAPFTNGLLGEVSSLPYQVAPGTALFVDYFTVEPGWGAAIIPFIGDPPLGATSSLDTLVFSAYVQSGGGSIGVQQTRNIKAGYWIPAGKKLSLWMSTSPGQAAGQWQWEWSAHGFLCNTP